jgi:hypothetical protein
LSPQQSLHQTLKALFKQEKSALNKILSTINVSLTHQEIFIYSNLIHLFMATTMLIVLNVERRGEAAQFHHIMQLCTHGQRK